MNMTPTDVYSVLMDAGFTPADTFDTRDGKMETFYGGRAEAVLVALYPADERLVITGLEDHGCHAWDLTVSLAVPKMVFLAALGGAVGNWPVTA